MKKIILLLCVMVGSVCLAGSIQSDNQISDTSNCTIYVVNEDGQAIDEVFIQVQNSSINGQTDIEGKVTLNCEEDAVFILSHPAYTTTQASRDSESILSVVMTADDSGQN